MNPASSPRRDVIAANLAAVHRRIDAACVAAGREPGSVKLVVVTKFHPASDVRLLAELGVTDVGENRHQEAADKVTECADLDLTWHFIGGLQSNKAAAVASYASVVESVDRPKLVEALSRGAGEAGRDLDVLLQVSLDDPEGRGERSGVEPERLPELADLVIGAERLNLRGLMAVAPLGVDPTPAFERLRGIAADFVAAHPAATVLSAGMSGDLEEAIAAGATHVRVGSAILGNRVLAK